MAYGSWAPYVPVAKRREQAQRALKKRSKKGLNVCPIEIEGRKITRTFWGEAWCHHLESFGDYDNRLPRGKRYVRNGSVCHLEVSEGQVKAIVSGSELYDIDISIKPLAKNHWESIRENCAGQIGSILELLEGKLSDSVMAIVTHPETGLFPQVNEIKLNCNCPDWAKLCKHLAAVLYGVGALLDKQPELLFKLRGVDHETLVSTNIAIPTGSGKRRRLDSDIGDVFGIELDSTANTSSRKTSTSSKVTTKNKRANVKKSVKRTPIQAKAKTPSRKKPLNPTSATVSRLRKRLNLSVAQMAQLIGVSSSSITLWETKGGRLNLRASSMQALEVAYTLEKSEAWDKLGL